jgi:hypothetical protein
MSHTLAFRSYCGKRCCCSVTVHTHSNAKLSCAGRLRGWRGAETVWWQEGCGHRVRRSMAEQWQRSRAHEGAATALLGPASSERTPNDLQPCRQRSAELGHPATRARRGGGGGDGTESGVRTGAGGCKPVGGARYRGLWRWRIVLIIDSTSLPVLARMDAS